jgi:hypothetical protein
MDAGLRAQRATLDDGGFPGCDRMLVKQRRGKIPMDRGQILEAKFVGAMGAIAQTRFLHEDLHDASGGRRTTPCRHIGMAS